MSLSPPQAFVTPTSIRYKRLLGILRDAPAYLPLVMIPFGLLAHTSTVDHRFYTSDTILLGIVAAYSAASALYFYAKRQKDPQNIYMICMAIFHILCVLFVLFISGFLSVFVGAWIVLMISSDLHFGRRGFFASFFIMAVGGFLNILNPLVLEGERIEIIQAVIVIGIIAYIISRIRGITDHEINALNETREREILQRERLLALVNSMGEAVISTDAQGIITVSNAAFLSLVGDNVQPVGQHFQNVFRMTDNKNMPIDVLIEARNRPSVIRRTDLIHAYASGETIKLYLNIAPIKPDYQRVEQGYIIILRDITKEKTLDDEHQEFVSVISHELRTPVTILEGTLSNVLAQKNADPATVTKAVENAHKQVTYMAQMINGISALSEAEHNTNVSREDIRPGAYLSELREKYMAEAIKKNLELTLDIEPGLPDIHTTRFYLDEIMQNLITNAIKYTPIGRVTLIGHNAPNGVVLGVKDSGIGIGKADKSHLFEKFYRSEDYHTRETRGIGLGLYICQVLASKLGSRIRLESELNQGSTFYLIVPASQSPLQPAPVPMQTPAQAPNTHQA